MKTDRLDEVPIREWNDLTYVDLLDIPEPARNAFQCALYGTQCPFVSGVKETAYSWDWTLFLGQYHRAN